MRSRRRLTSAWYSYVSPSAARGRGLFGRSLRADDDGGEPAMLGGERDGGMSVL